MTDSHEETKFDKKDLRRDLKAAGLPAEVAEEVADRVEDRVEDGWTYDQVRREVDLELQRLKDDIDNAHKRYMSSTTREVEGSRDTSKTKPVVLKNVNE